MNRSISLDQWSDEELLFMKLGGNSAAYNALAHFMHKDFSDILDSEEASVYRYSSFPVVDLVS